MTVQRYTKNAVAPHSPSLVLMSMAGILGAALLLLNARYNFYARDVFGIAAGIAAAAWVLFKTKSRLFSPGHRGISLAGGFLLGAAVFPALRLRAPFVTGVWLALVLLFCFLLFAFLTKGVCLLFLTAGEAAPRSRISPARVFWGVFLVCAISLGIHWIQYFPAGESSDSIYQWGQTHGQFSYTNLHTVGHPVLLKLLLSVYDSNGTVVFVHIVLVAFLTAKLYAYMYTRGAEYKHIMLLTVLFTCCFSPAWVYMYPWKDTPYTLVLGILTYFLMKLQEKEYTVTVAQAAAMGLCLSLAFLFRYNGIVPAIACGAYFLYWLLRHKKTKEIFILLSSSALCLALVYLYAYQVMGMMNVPNGFSIQVFASGIAAVVKNGGVITPEQYQLIAKLLPIDWMKEHYVPWQTVWLIWTQETPKANSILLDPAFSAFNNHFVLALGEHPMEVVRLYFALLPRNLGICITDILYNTYILWGFTDVNVFYNHIFLTVILLCAIKIKWGWKGFLSRGIVFLPVMLNALSIAVSTITNEQRYLLCTFTLFGPLLLYVLTGKETLAHLGIGEAGTQIK